MMDAQFSKLEKLSIPQAHCIFRIAPIFERTVESAGVIFFDFVFLRASPRKRNLPFAAVTAANQSSSCDRGWQR